MVFSGSVQKVGIIYIVQYDMREGQGWMKYASLLMLFFSVFSSLLSGVLCGRCEGIRG